VCHREHDDLDPLGAQGFEGGGVVSLTGSAIAMIPATWSSTPTKMTVSPSTRSRSACVVSTRVESYAGQEVGAAEPDPPVLDRAHDAFADGCVEVGDVRDRQTGVCGGVDDGQAEWVLGGSFDPRYEPERVAPHRARVT
jgi:hypothetical protein